MVRDIAGPFDASVEWFSTLGEVQIDESDDNVLTSGSKNGTGTAATKLLAFGKLVARGASPLFRPVHRPPRVKGRPV